MKSLPSLLLALTLGIVAAAPAQARPGASPTATAPTRHVEVDGHAIAYRIVGTAQGTPLLLLNRFRGTMDHWDPLLVDRLAARRRVILFDQPGFARSSGTAPDSLPAFAASAARLVEALGLRKVDVLGFSMGGTVALQLALDRPDLVRRLVIAGSGPGFVPAMPPGVEPAGPRVWQVATKPVNDDEDFLFLFFEDSATSRAAGKAYLDRLRQRRDAFERHVDAAAWQAQLKSAQGVGTEATTLMPRLAKIPMPVLVANGRHDIMVPTYASYAMAQALPDARLVVYPDSGHGFLFQHAEAFADDVQRFLR